MKAFFFKNIKDYNLREKCQKVILPSFYNDEIIINTKTHFYTDEKLFELFCTKNAFEKGNG